MYFDDTGLPWVMPSPNIPTLDSAIVYPGAVLFEGTMLSEGRGTTRPFELIGAPWIDGEALAAAMNARGLPGVHFRATFFEPTFQKHAKQTCGGCQLHVLDRQAFQPVRVAVELDRRIQTPEPHRLRLAPAALRVRARQVADRHPVRIGSAADDHRCRRRCGKAGRVVGRRGRSVQAHARALFDVLTRRQLLLLTDIALPRRITRGRYSCDQKKSLSRFLLKSVPGMITGPPMLPPQ